MPIGIDVLLVIIALILAVVALAGKPTLAPAVVVLCVEALLRLAGR